MAEKDKITIELCMGSSCFARGNSVSLNELEEFINDNNLEDRVELEGHLCSGLCNSGPHVIIDGTEYSQVNSACIIDLLKEKLNG